MTRRAIGAGVLVEATLLFVFTSVSGAAELSPPDKTSQPHIELFQEIETLARLFTLDRAVGHSRHRLRLELQGARAQAEDWLHDAGFSLLEERDLDGHHSYAVVSGALTTDWPVIRLRARLGQAAPFTGMRLRDDLPAIGVAVPYQRYTVELEGAQDRSLGYVVMGTLRWSDPQQRVQYGIALPLAVGRGPSIGTLFQLRIRLDP